MLDSQQWRIDITFVGLYKYKRYRVSLIYKPCLPQRKFALSVCYNGNDKPKHKYLLNNMNASLACFHIVRVHIGGVRVQISRCLNDHSREDFSKYLSFLFFANLILEELKRTFYTINSSTYQRIIFRSHHLTQVSSYPWWLLKGRYTNAGFLKNICSFYHSLH